MTREASVEVIPGQAAVSVNDPGSDLPEGWQRVRLTNIARLESGHTPSRQHPEWWGGDVPWVSLPDARNHHGGVIFDTLQKTNEDGLANSAARWLPKDTVCLSRTASVGYVFRLGRPMATSQDFVNWVCSDALDPRYLMYALLAEGDHIRNFGKGTTHTTIYFPEVLAFHLALAPLPEQRRIVAKVESLLDEVNRAKARLDRVPVILKRFRQAVLAAACSGELTPSSDADAWKTTQIGSVAGFITSGSRGWAAYYSDAGPLFIRAQNLNSDQLILDDVAHVTPPKNSETARTRVQKNDVLVTITGANVTKSGLVTSDLGDAYVSQHVGLIRPLDGRMSRWLYTWLLSPAHGRKQLLDFAYGAGKPGLNLDNLRNVEISLPPLDEQAEIVRQVDALFALADAIERRVAVATARAEKLPQAILAKAFAGELVPTEAELARAEGRDYETAAALLARVARDAATGAPTAAPKRRGRPPKSAR